MMLLQSTKVRQLARLFWSNASCFLVHRRRIGLKSGKPDSYAPPMGSNRHRQHTRKSAAPKRSKRSRSVFRGAILAVLIFFGIVIYRTVQVKNTAEIKSTIATKSSTRTLKDLLALSPAELDRMDSGWWFRPHPCIWPS